jgi:ABC-type oligopeptide transport system substrate-binding subunit
MKKVVIVFAFLAMGVITSCNTKSEELSETESLYEHNGPDIFGVDKDKIERPGSQGGG